MRFRPVTALAAAAGALASGAAYARFRRDMARRREALAIGSELVVTAMGRIEVGRAGQGPAALVVHGAGGGYDQGLMIGRDLLGEGYGLIAPSRFGYLRTPLPEDASPARQADAHAALLDRLGIDKAVVAGVSAGAPSAIEFALNYPERTSALILLVPQAYAPDVVMGVGREGMNPAVLAAVEGGADFAFWALARISRATVARFLGVPSALAAAASLEERRRLDDIIADILPLSDRVAGIRADSAVTLEPLPLELIAAPTLVMTTRDDLYRSLPGAEHVAAHVPDAELVVFDDGGHLLVGRHDEARRIAAAFLARSGAGAQAGSMLPVST